MSSPRWVSRPLTEAGKVRLREAMEKHAREDDAEAAADPTHHCKLHTSADVASLGAWFRKVTYGMKDDDSHEGRIFTEGEAVDALNWVESTLREDSPAGVALRDRLGLPLDAQAALDRVRKAVASVGSAELRVALLAAIDGPRPLAAPNRSTPRSRDEIERGER